MSRVAIVFPYFRTRAPTEMLFPPLGAAFLASQLRQFSIETRIFDCTFCTFDQLNSDLIAYHRDVVGIYSMVTHSRNTFLIAETVRTYLPDSMLVAGGPRPTLFPERYQHAFDAVFRGEADISFPRFCRDLFEHDYNRRRLADLPLESYARLYIQTPEFPDI